MSLLRVSATAVEAFRLFSQPDQEWMSADDLDRQILHTDQPNLAMARGEAMGKIIEDGGMPYLLPDHSAYMYNGLRFDYATMTDLIARYDRRGLFEAKAYTDYSDVRVVSKADHLVGTVLTETKSTEKPFDAEKYAASYQWRLMTDTFRPNKVIYRIAKLDERAGVYVVEEVTDLPLYPYPGLYADCKAMVAAFRDYVVARGLDGALRERQARSEAA